MKKHKQFNFTKESCDCNLQNHVGIKHIKCNLCFTFKLVKHQKYREQEKKNQQMLVC